MAQHDQNVGNGSGAVVRGDVNDALAALFSLSSGATAPSTTVAYQWWVDTANGLLKQRNAANTAWITRGDLTTAFLQASDIGVGAGNIVGVDQAVGSTASAGTTSLSGAIEHSISGTATVTAFSGVAGVRYRCRAGGAFTLTHHATNLILPGSANIVAAAGDTFEVFMLTSSTCFVTNYQRASGVSLSGGGLLQVAYSNDTTIRSAVSSTFVDSSSSITITGVTAGSVLKISAVAALGHSVGGQDIRLQIRRGTTDITPGGLTRLNNRRVQGSADLEAVSLSVFDAGHSGGSITYRLYWSTSAGTAYLGRAGGDAGITAPSVIWSVEELSQ